MSSVIFCCCKISMSILCEFDQIYNYLMYFFLCKSFNIKYIYPYYSITYNVKYDPS